MRIQRYFENLLLLKFSCIAFWACWFSLACATNIFDFMSHLGIVSPNWPFKSGNYALLAGVLAIYNTPNFILNLCFICDIFAQLVSALLFSSAAFRYLAQRRYQPTLYAAFTVSIGLWMVFLILEEVFIAYRFESVQGLLFIMEMLSLIFLSQKESF